jgi:glutathione S-transferase
MSATTPILYHDPTSEPSRAVHWFCLAAEIPIAIEYVWLTRSEHRSAKLLAVNPRHQVPALAHDEFHLSEATAIMSYLAEVAGCRDRWFGDSARARAYIDMLLSWYHTNLRLEVTVQYFLPVLLVPAYFGRPHTEPQEVARIRAEFAETLSQLNDFLSEGPFLAGESATVPDLLFAAELFALDIDPQRDTYLNAHPHVVAWLERMRTVSGYDAAHVAWNHVAPMITAKWRDAPGEDFDPAWVADACLAVLSRTQ